MKGSKRLRVLFIHEVNYLEKPIFEMHEFPELLCLRGHEVGFVHFPEEETLRSVMRPSGSRKVRGRVHPVEIELFQLLTISGGLLGRLFTAAFSLFQLRKIFKQFRPDVVVTYAIPTFGPQAVVAARSLGIPIVYRAIDLPSEIRQTVFARAILLAERFVIRRVDLVSTHNGAMARRAQAMAERVSTVAVTLPPVDLELFDTKSDRGSLRAFGVPENKFTIVYLGSLFYFSGLEEIIVTIPALHDTFNLVIIGSGSEQKKLKNLVIDLGLQSRVFFLGHQAYEDLPPLLRAAHVGINPLKVTAGTNVALPQKVLLYIASGLTVASTPLDGLRSVVGPESSLVHWADSPRELLELCLTFDAQKVRDQNTDVARKFLQDFTPVAVVVDFEKLLFEVCNPWGE